MKKTSVSVVLAVLSSLVFSVTSFASGWISDANGYQ